MVEFVLQPHPDFPSVAIRSVTATARREAGALIDLEFCLTGAIDAVAWPEPRAVTVADRLWEHTCLEAFVGDEGQGYREFNFTTSGEWAAYRFDAYRDGMRPGGGVLLAGGRTVGNGRIALRRTFRVSGLRETSTWRVGLSAVIEVIEGSKSFWALAHPRGKPDFHDPDCFIVDLPPPDAA